MRGVTAIGVLCLALSAWLIWVKSPISGGANPSVSFAWLSGVIGGIAGLSWLCRSHRIMVICGVAGLGLASFSLIYLTCIDPTFWYLVDENDQAANIISFSSRHLPGNFGIQPTFRTDQDTDTLLGRLTTALYFMSWGWQTSIAGSLLLLVGGFTSSDRRQPLRWASLSAILIFGGQAALLGSSLVAEYLRDMGNRHMAFGHYAEAVRRYESAQRWNPQLARSPQMRFRLGEAYYHLDMPTHPNARLFVGERYTQHWQFQAAVAEYVLALQDASVPLQELLAKRIAWIHVEKGIAQYREGQLGPAIGDWEQALAFDPAQLQAVNFLARGYFEQSRYERSIAMSQFLLSRSQNRLLYEFRLSIMHRCVLLRAMSDWPPQESRRCAKPSRSSPRI